MASKTDARGLVTTYTYDVLNRMLSKTYSSDENKSVSSCFQYDVPSVTNGVGRLGAEWTQVRPPAPVRERRLPRVCGADARFWLTTRSPDHE